VGAIALQATVGGAGFVPVSDRREISCLVETPPSSNLEYSGRKVEEVGRIARAHPEVAYTYSTIGIPLPLSLTGVVLALLVTGDTLNIMSLIGVILLMGIVAKNAILLIDFAKWARERGTPLREALIEAGRIRLRPIMMTTVALIAGMIPVALGRSEGADFRAPLGRAVIGGVITSTLLTLLVIPTAYEILDGWKNGILRLARRLFGHRARPEPAAKVAAGNGTGEAAAAPREE
jgi:HAE1 family hydrophobic/amphiphilic exporter-1